MDLFLDLGIGKGAYALIEQGRVDALLMARPVERRGLIEQAAGIIKYKSRKKEAIQKLTQTERNLERVRDVLSEVKSRRIILARQARKAEKYRRLKREVEELQQLVAQVGTKGSDAAGRSGTKKSLELDTRFAQISAEVSILGAAFEKACRSGDAVYDELNSESRRKQALELSIDALEEKLSSWKTRNSIAE